MRLTLSIIISLLAVQSSMQFAVKSYEEIQIF